MLLCAVLLHGGCGSRTTEETEKVDTTENFDLIGTEGWEYQGEKKQYIYGEWTVTGVRKGDTWDETDERVGALCMSCYRRTVPTKAARNRTH